MSARALSVTAIAVLLLAGASSNHRKYPPCNTLDVDTWVTESYVSGGPADVYYPFSVHNATGQICTLASTDAVPWTQDAGVAEIASPATNLSSYTMDVDETITVTVHFIGLDHGCSPVSLAVKDWGSLTTGMVAVGEEDCLGEEK